MDYEKYIVGYMIGAENTPLILSQINEDYFIDTKMSEIFSGIKEITKKGEFADILTLDKYLNQNTNWYKNEGVLFISDLIEYARNVYIWEECLQKIKENYKNRKLNNLYRDLKDGDIEQSEKIRKNIDKVMQECEVKEQKETQMQKMVKQANENIALYKQKGLAGWSWGPSYLWLNQMTGGIRNGKTYRIAGQSGAGKTSFIYEVLYNLLNQNAKVLFIEMEGQDTIYFNLMSTILGVNPRHIENGKVQADNEHILKYENYLHLLIDENNIDKIKAEIIRLKPNVVILDYIGLVNIPGFDENTKYSEYADQIKMFIQNHQEIAFIDLSNLPKSDNSEDMIRLNRGFNGSAKLRNNCDFGMHIFDHAGFVKYKKETLEMGTPKDLLATKVMTFLISKNRFGPDGVEKQYMINFNQGIRFKETSEQDLEKFNSYK